MRSLIEMTWRCKFSRLGLASLALLGTSLPAAAQVNFERLYPPVVSAGETATVTAEGKFPSWPPQILCDRNDLEITAAKDSGKLEVRVPEATAPGIAWIRLADSKSASTWVPLLITPADVVQETEPNDRVDQTEQVPLPAVIAGRLAKSGDSDAYRLDLEAGSTLVATLTANSILKSPMDAVLQLTDTKGNVLVQSDDDRGLDPQIVYTAERDTECVLRVFAFPETPNSTIGFAGGNSFVYAVQVTTGPFLDHVAVGEASVLPFGYNLDAAEDKSAVAVQLAEPTVVSPAVASLPGALGWDWVRRSPDAARQHVRQAEFSGTLPAVISGHIKSPDDRHALVFQATKGTRYRASVQSKAYGFPLDSELVIVDQKSGSELARNDDVSRGGYDAAVEFTAKEDGPVEVRIGDLVGGFGTRHFYELTLAAVTPKFAVSLASGEFTVSVEKPLEIPVTIERSGGYSGKLEISAVDLPDGLRADPVVSEAKGDTSKSVKLKLTATDAAAKQTVFRVVAKPVGEGGDESADAVEATFPLRPSVSISEFFLTVSQDVKE